jgi:putative PEP-CTERM system histidine kinase
MNTLGIWSQMVAACLYGALSLWQLRHWQSERRSHPLTAAFAITAAWMVFQAVDGPRSLLAGLAESARNVAFLAFMYGIVAGRAPGQQALKTVYGAVAAVIGFQIIGVCILYQLPQGAPAYRAMQTVLQTLGLLLSAGALILVHNLYAQAKAESRHAIRLPMLALAAMWTYDLHLYTVAYLTGAVPEDLVALRGAMLSLLVPFFTVAGRKNGPWTVQLSRAATFQSLSMLAIFAYLVVMMSATRALEAVDARWVDTAQAAILVMMTATLLVLLPSRQARAWMRVKAAKHFFQHRYDYRAEWLRFTRTMAQGGAEALPLDVRVVKALARIAEAPAGLMLDVDAQHRFSPSAQWNWPDHAVTGWTDPALGRFLEESAHIIDFGMAKNGTFTFQDTSLPLPAPLSRETVWAGIPLLHNERLIGLVLLAPPPVPRRIDWEDIDLFRTAGVEAASYLAEARAQEELSDARKFDEFSRRFAFIMHDIKNLVSQISLVARNAERHADNPAFRADMIVTLQGSVRKMNELLARLSRGGGGEVQPPRAIDLRALLQPLVEAKRRTHPVEFTASAGITALADAQGLEQAVIHLLQNAIDASTPNSPVWVTVGRAEGSATIEIIDRGRGMSGDFIRTRLFQPFASTKEAGFGIGAYEARSLVQAMGGRLTVESREGEGTRFQIVLPEAAASALHDQRISA